MRMNRYYMPTLREVPVEAEIPSHQLLLRAGMIRKAASGIYSFLPLGQRVVQKIEAIVREEMDRAGSQEIRMSALQPREIWEKSGRWQTFGPEMFKLTDRGEREFCLGPTAEEYFTDLITGEVRSYKQLPLNLYQIQWKYRDEKRPRFGINRSREFLMKDAYSFDSSIEGMEKSYQEMWDAYVRVFDRIGFDYRIVHGDSGAMGGNHSHEFCALSEVGEGVICYCSSCDYAATDEKASFRRPEPETAEMLALDEVETPHKETIEEVSEFLGVSADRTMKAVVLRAAGEPVIVLIPGDRELNEAKLIGYLKVPEHEIEMLDDETIRRVTGAEPGYTGPIGLKEEVRVICDRQITEKRNLVCGANKTGFHIINANYGRDFEAEVCDDLLLVREGDLCPECGAELQFARGIEVGNIFQLGTKYSESMNATFLDENGVAKPFLMGSYGIGITRCVSAVVEQNHDDKGIIWPLVVAPFHAIVTIANYKNDEQCALGEKIYEDLKKAGVEALLDDRKERTGVKFNDRDLIGIPYRITVGKKAGENLIEFSTRKECVNREVSPEEAIAEIADAVRALR